MDIDDILASRNALQSIDGQIDDGDQKTALISAVHTGPTRPVRLLFPLSRRHDGSLFLWAMTLTTHAASWPTHYTPQRGEASVGDEALVAEDIRNAVKRDIVHGCCCCL